jgi:hypothetical protein
MKLRLVAITTILAAGCADKMPGEGDDDSPDGGSPPPPPPPMLGLGYDGTYTLAETWDLSQPFGPDGVGGVVADIMIEQVVSLAGVPSPLEDEARDLVAEAVRQPIIDYVDSVVPEDVGSDSATLATLKAIFDDVDAGGTISFTASASNANVFTGTHTITSIAVTHEQTYQVSMPELLADSGAVSVAGDFSGSGTGATTMSIGSHPLELRYGKLVEIVARDVLQIDTAALGQQAADALDCAQIVDRITTGDSYEITVQGQGFDVAATALETACAAGVAEIREAALGLVRDDAGIRLGGPASLADPSGDGVADAVASGAGYGGAITSLPLPFEPSVIGSFTAQR